MVSPVRPVKRNDERLEAHRTSTCGFFGEVGATMVAPVISSTCYSLS
jgi:hypothetical protein